MIWLGQGSYLDDLSRCSGKNMAIVRWVFHPLPRPVGFALDLLYESGSHATPYRGRTFSISVLRHSD